MKGIELAKFNLLNFASWEIFSWFLLSADFFLQSYLFRSIYHRSVNLQFGSTFCRA